MTARHPGGAILIRLQLSHQSRRRNGGDRRSDLSNVPIPAHVYTTPIEDLNLSMRAYNCLRRSNIKLVGQVLR